MARGNTTSDESTHGVATFANWISNVAAEVVTAGFIAVYWNNNAGPIFQHFLGRRRQKRTMPQEIM
jgi:hypothetical protein